MSQKEVKRVQVLDGLKENKIDRQEASRRLCITTRQGVRRLRRRYQLDGLPDGSARSVARPQTDVLTR